MFVIGATRHNGSSEGHIGGNKDTDVATPASARSTGTRGLDVKAQNRFVGKALDPYWD